MVSRSPEEERHVMLQRRPFPRTAIPAARRARQWCAIGTALATATAFAACGSDCGDNDSAAPTSTAAITTRLAFPPTTLDPHTVNDIAGLGLIAYAYDSALALRDGRIVSGLATRWDATPTQAKLWIKPDVTCSDGSA